MGQELSADFRAPLGVVMLVELAQDPARVVDFCQHADEAFEVLCSGAKWRIASGHGQSRARITQLEPIFGHIFQLNARDAIGVFPRDNDRIAIAFGNLSACQSRSA